MGSFVADEVIKALIEKGSVIKNSKVLILGITFKENCPDIRNTGVVGVVRRLNEFGLDTTIYDPWANPSEVMREYNLQSFDKLSNENFDAIILAVAHHEFKSLRFDDLTKPETIIYDVKGFLENSTHNL